MPPVLPPPIIASILAGEAIYNLRAALDYLVFELAHLDSGSEQNGTQFPIEDTEEGFGRRRATFLKGVKDDHVAFIEVLQPYKRTHWTQILRDISNPDKHRKLVTTDHRAAGNVYLEHGPKGSFYGRTGGRVYEAPDDPSVDVYMEADITLHISFKDIRPVEDVLNDLVSQIRATLLEFEPCFAGDCGHSPPVTAD